MSVQLARSTPKICFIFFLILFLWSTQATACGEACPGPGNDCSGSECSYCDPTFHICLNCCDAVDELNCLSPCNWTSGECRNLDNQACAILVPEVPKAGQPWLLVALGIFILLIPVAYFRFFKKKAVK